MSEPEGSDLRDLPGTPLPVADESRLQSFNCCLGSLFRSYSSFQMSIKLRPDLNRTHHFEFHRAMPGQFIQRNPKLGYEIN